MHDAKLKTHQVVSQNVYSTIFCTKHLGGRSWHSLAPLHRHPGVSLSQMVGELLKKQKDLTKTIHIQLLKKEIKNFFKISIALTWYGDFVKTVSFHRSGVR